MHIFWIINAEVQVNTKSSQVFSYNRMLIFQVKPEAVNFQGSLNSDKWELSSALCTKADVLSCVTIFLFGRMFHIVN